MMDQPSNTATFTKENDNEDYTPILLKILEPSEVFIQNYKNHINEQEVINKLEKLLKVKGAINYETSRYQWTRNQTKHNELTSK